MEKLEVIFWEAIIERACNGSAADKEHLEVRNKIRAEFGQPTIEEELGLPPIEEMIKTKMGNA